MKKLIQDTVDKSYFPVIDKRQWLEYFLSEQGFI